MKAHELEVVASTVVAEVLCHALGTNPRQMKVTSSATPDHDLTITAPRHRFVIEVKAHLFPPDLHRVWDRLRRVARREHAVPVIVVPFMTERAGESLSGQDINWLDLSGNVDIRAQDLRLRIAGQPNRYARPGRPASVFERRSSRVTRQLLLSPGRDWSVNEAAEAADLDKGHVSRILRRLLDDRFLTRGTAGRFKVHDPAQLLEAWRDATDFTGHRILKGHVAARSGEELLRRLAERLSATNKAYAATGLAAAWIYDHFAMFRLATLFIREWPSSTQLAELGFREEASGANTWLALPNDDGVFDGARDVEGVRCVAPIQVYVDLKNHPERAAEAAEHLKAHPALLGTAHGK